jgi:hypothetical protein
MLTSIIPSRYSYISWPVIQTKHDVWYIKTLIWVDQVDHSGVHVTDPLSSDINFTEDARFKHLHKSYYRLHCHQSVSKRLWTLVVVITLGITCGKSTHLSTKECCEGGDSSLCHGPGELEAHLANVKLRCCILVRATNVGDAKPEDWVDGVPFTNWIVCTWIAGIITTWVKLRWSIVIISYLYNFVLWFKIHHSCK